MGLLDGRRAVVTGGGSGIGRATCRRMTDEGARVAVVDVNGDAAEQVAKEIDGLAYAVDVTDYDALERRRRRRRRQARRASAPSSTTPAASNLSQVHDWPVEEWDRIVAPQPRRRLPRHQGERPAPARQEAGAAS